MADWTNEILPAVVALLESVEGLASDGAKVYSYPQRTIDVQGLIEKFKTSGGVFHVWWPKRIGWNAEGGLGGQILRQQIIRLYGYRGFKDSGSELEFQTILDNIAAVFDARENLSIDGAVAEHLPLTLVESTDEMFAGVLCHKAIFEFAAYT